MGPFGRNGILNRFPLLLVSVRFGFESDFLSVLIRFPRCLFLPVMSTD